MEEDVCFLPKVCFFASIEISAVKDILKKNAKTLVTAPKKIVAIKDIQNSAGNLFFTQVVFLVSNVIFYTRKKIKSPEQTKQKRRLEMIQKLIEDKSEEQKKIELAVKELERVVKAMSRKVIQLEEELMIVKDSQKNSFKLKQEEGIGEKEIIKENVIVSKGDISVFLVLNSRKVVVF